MFPEERRLARCGRSFCHSNMGGRTGRCGDPQSGPSWAGAFLSTLSFRPLQIPTLLKWLRPNDYLVIPNGELELVNLWELVSWWGQVLKIFYKVTRLFYLKTKTKKTLDSGRAGSYAITTPLFIVNILTLKKKKKNKAKWLNYFQCLFHLFASIACIYKSNVI